MPTSSSDLHRQSSTFSHTRWTLVLRADASSNEGRKALSDLCQTYYQPVFVFLRRLGWSDDVAREHTHSFFAHLLERGFPGPDPARGRFRNYLLGAVKYFVGDLHAKTKRLRRGGGCEHESIDATDADTEALQLNDPNAPALPEVFDREWALAVMNRATAELANEYAGPKRRLFDELHPWLTGNSMKSQATTASELGLSESAVKAAVHRLRKRFRELLRQEIAQTLDDTSDLDDELRYLCSVLGK